MACGKKYSKQISFRKLLTHLHSVEFRYIIPKDSNRAKDGVKLRYRFALDQGYEDEPEIITDCLDEPCSILEMILALAIRCEETIMDNPQIGDRTRQWFWEMLANLGLSSITDERYDREYVDEIIHIFLDRKYKPDGRGGLFVIKNCDRDLRDVEIWYQMCWHLNDIV